MNKFSFKQANWKQHEVLLLNSKGSGIKLPAEFQIVTEKWNQIVRVPYLIFMPEKEQLLMLVGCGDPLLAMVMTSNDWANSWTEPVYVDNNVKEREARKSMIGVSLTYLGNGKIIFSLESSSERYFSDDYGQSWSKDLSKLPNSDGNHWYQWDPYLVDKDPVTGKVTRIWETGWNNWVGSHYTCGYLRFSTDEGRTWSKDIRVPAWHGVSEVALHRAKNGNIVAACRTKEPKRFKGEIDHYYGLGISISKDNGQTWSSINRLYEWGRHHPSMLTLPNGDIIMTYVVRKGYVDTPEGYPQFGIEAVISGDNGETWDLDHKYILADWEGNRKGPHAWWASSQSTSSVMLPDQSILTAFGTGYRSQPDKNGHTGKPLPHDIGLVRWHVGKARLDDDKKIRNARFDSDLRNIFDLNQIHAR